MSKSPRWTSRPAPPRTANSARPGGGAGAGARDVQSKALLRAQGLLDLREERTAAPLREPISLADIVAAAGVPERSLRAAFIAARGMPPGAFLRRRRFEIARQRLLAGAPGTTVAGVAASLGFVSGGRFSVEYKRLFDESPSDTLAASRGPAGPTTKRSPRAC
ncbi:helix-turn-helix domain-containing protein [Cystobacter fuscus]|uniref:helix-turn-helix domain-containing protein n=1 Tax=Cystobacter fuscus TaxID=43 RepID=UPI0037C0A265